MEIDLKPGETVILEIPDNKGKVFSFIAVDSEKLRWHYTGEETVHKEWMLRILNTARRRITKSNSTTYDLYFETVLDENHTKSITTYIRENHLKPDYIILDGVLMINKGGSWFPVPGIGVELNNMISRAKEILETNEVTP